MPEEDEHDEQYYLDLAMKLSMEPDGVTPGGDEPMPEQAQEQPKQPAADLKEIATTDFMKDIINDLGLDINEDALNDILNQHEKKDGDKKEEDKKDDEPKK